LERRGKSLVKERGVRILESRIRLHGFKRKKRMKSKSFVRIRKEKKITIYTV